MKEKEMRLPQLHTFGYNLEKKRNTRRYPALFLTTYLKPLKLNGSELFERKKWSVGKGKEKHLFSEGVYSSVLD